MRPAAAALIAGLGAASLVYAVRLTAADQAPAYFDSLARIWEFALGGLLALGVDALVLGARARALLGWAGVPGWSAAGWCPG